jgi:hypothetical protein
MHIDPLLHLNTVALALCVAYLGLDKAHVEPDYIDKRLAEGKEIALRSITKCDVHNGVAKNNGMHQRFPWQAKLVFFLLCHIADVSVSKGLLYPVHMLDKRIVLPPLTYYKKRRDRVFVAGYVIVCIIGLIGCTALALFDIHLEHDNFILSVFFSLYCLITISVVLSSIFAQRLKNFPVACERLSSRLTAHMDQMGDDFTRWKST